VSARVTFGPLDFIILGLFVAAILALGFSVRLRSNTILQFFAAGRTLTLPLFVASLVSLWYGGILGIGESVSFYGVGTWVLFGVPYYVFAIVYALWLAPRVRNAPQLSIPERLHLRFGRNVAILGAVLLLLLAVPAAHVLMLGTLVKSFSGLSTTASIVVGTIIGVSFLYRGGLLADARASLLAFLMMYVGFGVMVFWCLSHYPLVQTLSTLPREKLKWDGGTGLIFVISMFIIGAWTLVDPGFHQRVSSSANEKTGRTGVLISVGFWFLFDMLSITTALYAIALKTNGTGLDVLPAFAQQTLPDGLKAVFFCGMLGTIVSAMVGYSLVSGTTIGREIIGRLKPSLNDSALTQWSRVGIAIACALAIILARAINSVVDLWTAWAGAVVGAMLMPVLLAYRSGANTRTSQATICVSMAAGFLVSIAWMIYGYTHGNEQLMIILQRTADGYRLVVPGVATDQQGLKIAVGTLLPGLLTSALVIALGTALRRKGVEAA